MKDPFRAIQNDDEELRRLSPTTLAEVTSHSKQPEFSQTITTTARTTTTAEATSTADTITTAGTIITAGNSLNVKVPAASMLSATRNLTKPCFRVKTRS